MILDIDALTAAEQLKISLAPLGGAGVGSAVSDANKYDECLACQ